MVLYSIGLYFHHTSTAGRCIEYISDRNYCSLLSIFLTEKELSVSLVIGVARFCLCTFQTLYLLQRSLISIAGTCKPCQYYDMTSGLCLLYPDAE